LPDPLTTPLHIATTTGPALTVASTDAVHKTVQMFDTNGDESWSLSHGGATFPRELYVSNGFASDRVILTVDGSGTGTQTAHVLDVRDKDFNLVFAVAADGTVTANGVNLATLRQLPAQWSQDSHGAVTAATDDASPPLTVDGTLEVAPPANSVGLVVAGNVDDQATDLVNVGPSGNPDGGLLISGDGGVVLADGKVSVSAAGDTVVIGSSGLGFYGTGAVLQPSVADIPDPSTATAEEVANALNALLAALGAASGVGLVAVT
jgi:hypothetical protein